VSSVEADYTELRKLSVDLSQAGEDAGPKAQKIIRKGLVDITALGKRGAPVDTGFLRSSIKPSDLRRVGQTGVIEGETGPTADYGGFVENGTSRMAPRPYMAPAADAVEPGVVAAFEEMGGTIL